VTSVAAAAGRTRPPVEPVRFSRCCFARCEMSLESGSNWTILAAIVQQKPATPSATRFLRPMPVSLSQTSEAAPPRVGPKSRSHPGKPVRVVQGQHCRGDETDACGDSPRIPRCFVYRPY
jgi:hypothetical protein